MGRPGEAMTFIEEHLETLRNQMSLCMMLKIERHMGYQVWMRPPNDKLQLVTQANSSHKRKVWLKKGRIQRKIRGNYKKKRVRTKQKQIEKKKIEKKIKRVNINSPKIKVKRSKKMVERQKKNIHRTILKKIKKSRSTKVEISMRILESEY